MNRILYSCLFLFLFCLSNHSKAQALTATCSPNTNFALGNCSQCYNPTGNSGQAGVVAFVAVANQYTWEVMSPAGCPPGPTFTCTGIDCSTINISYACCGVFTIVSTAVNQTLVPGTALSTDTLYQIIACPGTGLTVTPTSTAICRGDAVSLTGSGAATYSWVGPGPSGTVALGNIPTINVSPTVNTTYTVFGTSALGCTLVGTASVAVQAATLSVTPATQTMCLAGQVCFTAATGAISNTSVAPGTAVTLVEWYQPPPGNPPFATGLTTCTNAAAGNFTAVMTHTGAAGTCTVQALSNVVIQATIPVSVTASSQSVCPGNQVTLTAVSIQTAPASYTWTPPNFPVTTGNPRIVTVNAAQCYTVNTNYTGCPGSASICLGILSLTPTLTAVAPAICPGTAATLTAQGGTTYTYRYINPFGGTLTIPPSPTTNTQVVHTPTPANWPSGPTGCVVYSVTAFGGGCSGSASVQVCKKVLTPTLSLSSPSICPATQFTMTTLGVKASPVTSYTYSAPYPPNILAATTASSIVHTPPVGVYAYTVVCDSLGCQGSATNTVFIQPLNTTLTASSASICPGNQFTLTATTSTGGIGTTQYAFSAPYVVTAPSNSTIPNPPDPTTQVTVHSPPPTPKIFNYTYTVTADSAGCTGTATVGITNLNLTPTASLASQSHMSVCPTNTMYANNFTIVASGLSANTNYTLTGPSGNIPVTAGTNTASTNQAGPFQTYTITTDSSGCEATSTFSVFTLALHPTITAVPNPVCSGVTVSLTTTMPSMPAGPNTFYAFLKSSPSAPIPSTVQPLSTTSVAVDNPTIVTNYTVAVDSSGCIGFDSVQVTITPPLVITASASSPTTCSGSTVALTVAGPTVANYSWLSPTQTLAPTPFPTASLLVVNPTVTTIYTVQAIDPGGCVGEATVMVSVNPTGSLSLVLGPQGTTLCPGQSATLSVSGGVNYTWTPSNTLNNAFVSTVAVTIPATGFPPGTIVFTVNANNGLGCNGVGTISVAVNSIPQLTITASANVICPGFTSTLTAFGANSYTWTGGGSTVAVQQQSIAVQPGSYTVTGSNGGSCISSSFTNVLQGAPLTIGASATSGTTCITSNSPKYSQPVGLTATGASYYSWYPYDPNHMTYSLGVNTTVRPPTSTCYTVIGVTSVCSGSTTICVNVIPQFTLNVVPPLPAMCLGDSMKLSIVNVGTGTHVAGPVSAFTYSWTEAANAPPISISNMLTQTVMVFPQNTTTYTVEVLDSRKCASIPRLVTVTVLPKPMTAISIPTINNVPTNTVCYVGLSPGPPDVLLNLTGHNINPSLPFGIVPTYTWVSPYESKYYSILTPPNNNAVTINAPLRAPSVVVYTLVSGYNGVPGCKRSDTVSVRVIDCRPVTSVSWTTAEKIDTVCTRQCITYMTLTDTMAGGPQTYTWNFAGGSPATSTLANPVVCYNLPSSDRGYNVILKVKNPYPVANSGSDKTVGALNYIKVVDIPNITIIDPGNLASDTTIRFGETINLKGTGGKTYNWSPNYNITSTTDPKVTVRPFRSVQYILTGFNSKQCSSSDTLNVIVIEDCGEMFVPNAFSPNGDGHNDVLKVNGICLQSMIFMVFNRWGEKIFESTDQTHGWDGTYKGEQMNTGVFVYRLEGKTYDNKAFSSKGNITLIR